MLRAKPDFSILTKMLDEKKPVEDNVDEKPTDAIVDDTGLESIKTPMMEIPQQQNRPKDVSKVKVIVDTNNIRNVDMYLYLDFAFGNPKKTFTRMLSVLNMMGEQDIINIYIHFVRELHFIYEMAPFKEAIQRSKATVRVHCSTVRNVSMIPILLAADELVMSKYACCIMKDAENILVLGETYADMTTTADLVKWCREKIGSYMLTSGFLEKEDIDGIFMKNKVVSMVGEDFVNNMINANKKFKEADALIEYTVDN